jgi:hypothetical protein
MGLSLLDFAIGGLLGRFSVRRYRHDRIAWARLQVLSLELKRLRSQRVSAQGHRQSGENVADAERNDSMTKKNPASL